jgi:DnaD/phage-associated family protein
MNYIKEINAFYDWLETNSLSTSSIVLWHALMHINNKAGWVSEFAVAVSVLSVKTGLSERTISNARNELKQKGRIDWKSRKGNQSAIYKIVPLSAMYADKTSDNGANDSLSAIDADNVSCNASDSTSDNASCNASALYKLNETKLNISSSTTESDNFFDKEFSELAQLYQQVIGQPNGLTADWISDLKSRHGFEWVKNAMLEAEKRGKRTKKYVEGILQNWKRGGGMKLKGEDTNASSAESNPGRNKDDQYAGIGIVL